jgi:hypothetical protein
MAKKDVHQYSYKTKDEVSALRERKSLVIDRELERLYKTNGSLTADVVLASAASTKSVLHKYFEWDDSLAAAKYRLDQAYRMIQASKMVVFLTENKASVEPITKGESVEVRRMVSAFRKEGFKMRADALGNVDMRKVIVDRKIGELRSWCRSVCDIDELAELRTKIEAEIAG